MEANTIIAKAYNIKINFQNCDIPYFYSESADEISLNIDQNLGNTITINCLGFPNNQLLNGKRIYVKSVEFDADLYDESDELKCRHCILNIEHGELIESNLIISDLSFSNFQIRISFHSCNFYFDSVIVPNNISYTSTFLPNTKRRLLALCYQYEVFKHGGVA